MERTLLCSLHGLRLVNPTRLSALAPHNKSGVALTKFSGSTRVGRAGDMLEGVHGVLLC